MSTGPDSDYDDAAKIYVPQDNEEFIDPRLKDCTYYTKPPVCTTPWLEAFAGREKNNATVASYGILTRIRSESPGCEDG